MTDYKQIIWLASYPKSGNTWVRCFLDAYLTGGVDINEILCSVSDDIAKAYPFEDANTLPVDIQQLARPAALLRTVRNYLSINAKTPLFIKTHSPNMLCNGIELLPWALTKKVIFIVRDPRDVLPSFSKHMGCDLDQGLEWMQDKYRTLNANDVRVSDFVGSWSDHTRSYMNADTHDVLRVRYEDLKEDPVSMFSLILEWAEIPVDKDRVKKAVEMVDIDRLKRLEERDGFREASPHAKRFFGQGKGWRKTLTPKQIHTIEKRFGSLMKRLNYLKSKAA